MSRCPRPFGDAPRGSVQAEGEWLARAEETNREAARRIALELDRTVLPTQGPPGSDKTYNGARMEELLDGEPTWVDQKGERKPLRPKDILAVAPYNAQVNALKEGLPGGIRVGTVDKFQGQEAPVVIHSTATSSVADAPRGMEFLFSPNRLNVATSRARCVVILVGSPELLGADCGSARQMRLANGVCRFGGRRGMDLNVPEVHARRLGGNFCGSRGRTVAERAT